MRIWQPRAKMIKLSNHMKESGPVKFYVIKRRREVVARGYHLYKFAEEICGKHYIRGIEIEVE
jgi:hypothetical protein